MLLKDAAQGAALRVESTVEELRSKIREVYGWREPIRVVLYRGFGVSGGKMVIRGRVLAGEELEELERDAGRVTNAIDMVKRFASREIPQAKVMVHVHDGHHEVVADEEGYISLEIDTPEPIHDGMWRLFWAELVAPRPSEQRTWRFDGRYQVPQNASFGVISDLDDTVLLTGATKLSSIIRSTMFHNAQTRLPFPGVGPFYRALQRSGSGHRRNPFWYVSSLPWNLYDFFQTFFDVHNLPQGSLFLRDLGLDEQKVLMSSHGDHKLGAIRQLMELYPDLRFVLIGDSGQHDAEIYSEVVREYPDRVLAIYLRDVSGPLRDQDVESIQAEVEALGVPFVVAEDMIPCAAHAASQGWIDESDLDRVSRSVDQAQEEEHFWLSRQAERATRDRRVQIAAGAAAVLLAGAGAWWLYRKRRSRQGR